MEISNWAGKIGLSLLALLFGVGFSLVGVNVAVIPLYGQVSGWADARSFVPVSAHVSAINLDVRRRHVKDATTSYIAIAQFRYHYQGRDYTGGRVGLSALADNFGSYQNDTYERLRLAQLHDTPVTLWIDAANPERALYDRELRLAMVATQSAFALLFPGIGMLALYALWHIWFDGQYALSRWRTNRARTIGENVSGALVTGVVASLWNLIAWPVAISTFDQAGGKPLPMLLVLPFPVIGLFLLSAFWRKARARWLRGVAMLELDHSFVPDIVPLEGRIRFRPGLGSRLDPAQLQCDVTIEVRRVVETGSKPRTVSVSWRQVVLNTRVARGTESVAFRVDLPFSWPGKGAIERQATCAYWALAWKAGEAEGEFQLPAI